MPHRLIAELPSQVGKYRFTYLGKLGCQSGCSLKTNAFSFINVCLYIWWTQETHRGLIFICSFDFISVRVMARIMRGTSWLMLLRSVPTRSWHWTDTTTITNITGAANRHPNQNVNENEQSLNDIFTDMRNEIRVSLCFINLPNSGGNKSGGIFG